jgi:hypothetical protein
MKQQQQQQQKLQRQWWLHQLLSQIQGNFVLLAGLGLMPK